MTPEQCRTARELLGWDVWRLAAKARVSHNTVQNVEGGRHWPSVSTVTALRAAFRAGGVEFTSSVAPGVRLRAVTPEQCREARRLLGWHCQRLGARAGLSHHAVAGFETGRNRSRPSTVVALRTALEAAGVEFTDGDAPGVRLPDSPGGPAGGFRARLAGFAEPQEGFEDDTLHRRETLELVRAYYRITEPAVRKRVVNLIKSLAPGQAGGDQRHQVRDEAGAA